jgi:hypothetical protein
MTRTERLEALKKLTTAERPPALIPVKAHASRRAKLLLKGGAKGVEGDRYLDFQG